MCQHCIKHCRHGDNPVLRNSCLIKRLIHSFCIYLFTAVLITRHRKMRASIIELQRTHRPMKKIKLLETICHTSLHAQPRAMPNTDSATYKALPLQKHNQYKVHHHDNIFKKVLEFRVRIWKNETWNYL